MEDKEISEHAVWNALRRVRDPGLKKDIVALGIVDDVAIEGSRVNVKLTWPDPKSPYKGMMEEEIRRYLSTVDGVQTVSVLPSLRLTGATAPSGPKPIPGIRHVILVGSGKGGVGKTTVSVNLAVALGMNGHKVGLMDTDVYGPNVPLMLGLPHGGGSGTSGNRIYPVDRYGIKVMSMALFVNENEALIWRGPMLHGVVKQFLQDVEWGELDYLVVDLPPGTGDVQLTLCQSVPLTGAVIVSTPQPVAWEDAGKAAAMFVKMGVPLLGFVENMSTFHCPHCGEAYDIFGRGGTEEAAAEFNVAFLGKIPLDHRIRVRGDKGEPIVLTEPEGEGARAFHAIVTGLIKRIRALTPVADEGVA